MAYFEWESDLEIDVEEIDDQHQTLIGIMNDLHDAVRARREKEVIGEIIDRLLDYAGYHFATEEQYFESLGYPDAVVHTHQHRQFVRDVTAFKQRHDSGAAPVSVPVLDFMRGWLRAHIQGTDKKFARFLREKRSGRQS